MRGKTLLPLGVVGVAAVVAALVFMPWSGPARDGEPAVGAVAKAAPLPWDVPRAAGPVASAPAAVAATPPAASASAAAAPADAPGQVSGALLAAFAQAGDLHAFALDALQRPAEGGLFYARLAALRCNTWQRETIDMALRISLQRQQTLTTAQLQTADKVRASCQQFPATEIKRVVVAVREQAGADPLLQAERLLAESEKQDPPSRRAAAARLLALADPLFLSETGALFRLARDPESARKDGVWFDGRWITDEEEQLAAVMALSVGACQPGQPCSTDAMLVADCVYHGVCERDWATYLRAQTVAEGLPHDLAERSLVLTQRVQRAVREQDVAFFVR